MAHMKWSEIKKAVEEAGIEEDDEIYMVQCEWRHGSKKMHKSRMGKAFKLSEEHIDSREDARGCAS